MKGPRAPSQTSTMGRRSFLGRTAAAGVATGAVPQVLSTDPVSAASGSCPGVSVCELTRGLEGWTIDKSWGFGINGLWNHNTEASREGGSLHYGRGTSGNYQTSSSRNSGRVYSPDFEIPSSGTNEVPFTVWREVETQDPGYDRFRLRILGNTSQTLYSVALIGNTSGFESHTIAIPAGFNGQTVQFQFDFDTRDGLYNGHEGVYVGRFDVDACQPAGAGSSIAAFAGAGFQNRSSAEALSNVEADAPVPPR